jgi:Right handed beta helix region
MRAHSITGHLLTAAAITAACGDPRHVAAPAFSAAPSECPTPATVVVTDEASLRAALDAARPGDVIGIDGMIGLTVDDTIATDNITLTCATPGSGLYAAGSEVFDLVNVFAKHVTIDRLVLDASGALDGPFFVFNDGLTAFAEDDQFTNNSATCSPIGVCGFVVGAPRTLIANNQFVASGSASGLHLQSGVDGAQIVDNTIVAETPSGVSAFGGIRVRDGSGVLVSGNAVLGPWSNSLAPTNVATSRFAFNRLEEARLSGIRMSTIAIGEVRMTDNVFQENRVSTEAAAAVLASLACRNAFAWNELESTTGGPGIVFFATTGANKLVGNRTTFVDDGAFDCNGDGVNDPNIITGTVFHGMRPDSVSSGPVTTVHGIVLQ